MKDVEAGDENELDWILSMETFDIMDSCGMESVGFREFCMLILIISALENKKLLQCLYEHGPLIFDIIGGG